MGRADALHQAVARAIADLLGERSFWADSAERRDERLAAAAIGVVLAEAQRAVEARRDEIARVYDGGAYAIGADDALGEALAVLAALGDETLEPPPLV